MAKITDFTVAQIEAAIKAEAVAHAAFFGCEGDAEHIAMREKVSRANLSHVVRTYSEHEILNYLIRFIPESAQPQTRIAEAWPIETEDQVEALARECGWNNRRFMTDDDYQIWCGRMRKFAQLALRDTIVTGVA